MMTRDIRCGCGPWWHMCTAVEAASLQRIVLQRGLQAVSSCTGEDGVIKYTSTQGSLAIGALAYHGRTLCGGAERLKALYARTLWQSDSIVSILVLLRFLGQHNHPRVPGSELASAHRTGSKMSASKPCSELSVSLLP